MVESMKLCGWEKLAWNFPCDIDNPGRIIIQLGTTSPDWLPPAFRWDVRVDQDLFAANRKSDHQLSELSNARIQALILFYWERTSIESNVWQKDLRQSSVVLKARVCYL